LSRIAIVILNWNGQALLERYLPSVMQFSQEAQVMVIDNASTDNSVSFLQNSYPQIQIIQNPKNLGFAGGYNLGLKTIEAEYLVLLNSDVEVTENWLQPIISLLDNEPRIAAVQPKILDARKKNHFEYAGACGGFLDRYAYPYCRGRIFETLEEDTSQYNEAIEVHWASGACFFIRKKVFDELKGLDEDLFAHMEEIDLCWRARGKGYLIYCEPASTVYHQGGATLSGHSPFKSYLNFRNNLIMLLKNDRSGHTFILLYVRLLLDGLSVVRFIFQGRLDHAWAVFKAHLHFYRGIGKTLKKRRELGGNSSARSPFSIVYRYFAQGRTTFDSL
jgi:GT2 family glycosyltransferase